MKPVIKGLHRHHVVPKHSGGTDDDDNIVYLTVDEHIQAHLDLYDKYGLEADRDAASLLLACKYRENSEVKQEHHRRACARGGKAAHKVKSENGFYERLGQLNSVKLKGRIRPDLSIGQKKTWENRPLKWFNDGSKDQRFLECPDGWKPGRLHKLSKDKKKLVSEKISALKWWNDGTIRVRQTERPGPQWKLGKKL